MSRSRSTERIFSRRQWARRWRDWRRTVLVALLAGVLGGAVWLVFFSSVLSVDRVTVAGTQTLTRQQVLAAADITPGRPLARVDLDATRQRIEQVPTVHDAEVRRQWPHTVTITVNERQPVAVVAHDGRLTLADDEGVLYRQVRQAPKGLPRIETRDERAATEAARVVATLPGRVADRVQRIEAPTMDSITLTLEGGRRVVWGSAAESRTKADVVAALIKHDGGQIDVSVPSKPIVDAG